MSRKSRLSSSSSFFSTELPRALNIISLGLQDSLSVHKTIKLLVNSGEVASNTALCVVANGVLLLGTIFMFDNGVVPALNHLRKQAMTYVEASPLPEMSGVVSSTLWSFYHLVWVLPIWILCYACSASWYQSIAEHAFRYTKGSPKKASIKEQFTSSVYALLVWLFLFLQVFALNALLPPLLQSIAALIQLALPDLGSSSLFALFIHGVLLFPLYSLRYLSLCCGFIGMSLLYGWYGFDIHWIALGLPPDERFDIIEKNWPYFLGFGIPYAVIIKSCSFFVGYGVYLLLFPFCIILSSISNHRVQDAEQIPPLHLFALAKIMASIAVKYVSKMAKIKTRDSAASHKKKI